jgi:hypothetical protein
MRIISSLARNSCAAVTTTDARKELRNLMLQKIDLFLSLVGVCP